MSSGLAELQARDTVKRLQQLKGKVDVFAAHARTLRAMSLGKSGIDDRVLLEEANQLLRELGNTFKPYQTATSRTNSIGRSLPSGPGAVSPWKFEMRAASQQFVTSLSNAEKEIKQLQNVTMTAMNDPLRTPSSPGDIGLDNLIDVVTGFMDLVTKWIEHRRQNR